MIRYLCVCFCLALVSAAVPLRAANRPHAGTDGQTERFGLTTTSGDSMIWASFASWAK
jgi:hypothetical protein